jgi:hypothetical protein
MIGLEMLHEGLWMLTDHDNVDVSNGLSPAPKAPRDLQRLEPRGLAQIIQERLDYLVGVREQKTLAVLLEGLDGMTQVLGCLLTESRQGCDLSGVERLCKFGYGGNGKFLVQPPGAFWPEMFEL